MIHGKKEVVSGSLEMQRCSVCFLCAMNKIILTNVPWKQRTCCRISRDARMFRVFVNPNKCSTEKKKLFQGHSRCKDVLSVLNVTFIIPTNVPWKKRSCFMVIRDTKMF